MHMSVGYILFIFCIAQFDWFMSQIISFSADSDFAKDFDSLIERSGYRNRSRFIRDAALFFADIQQRGDLAEMDEKETVEGHLVVYYQHDHGKAQKLLDLRHSDLIEVLLFKEVYLFLLLHLHMEQLLILLVKIKQI